LYPKHVSLSLAFILMLKHKQVECILFFTPNIPRLERKEMVTREFGYKSEIKIGTTKSANTANNTMKIKTNIIS